MLTSDRVLTVRLVRMHNIQQIPSTKLLRTGGCPGKIYLEGFLPHEFVKLTNLITHHGGVVLSPDDETIILSKTKDTLHSKYYPRFDVKWLYDSVRGNKLEDIGHYLLPQPFQDATVTVDGKPSSTVPKYSSTPMKTPQVTHPKTISRLVNARSSQPQTSNGSTREPSEKTDEDQEGVRKISQSSSRKLTRKSLPDNLKAATDTSNGETPGIGKKNTKRPRSLARVASPKMKRSKVPQLIADVATSPSKKMQEKEREKNAVRKDDQEEQNSSNMIDDGDDDLIANQIADALQDLENTDDECLLVESSMSSQDGDNLEHEETENYEENETDNKEEESADVTMPKDGSTNRREHSGAKKKIDSADVNAEARTRRYYTHEENEKIVQYLAENDLLDGPIPRGTWTLLARNFRDPPRTPMSIWVHFRRFILPALKATRNENQANDDQDKQDRKKLKKLIGHLHELSGREDASDDE